MSAAHVVEVTEANFQREVVDRSRQKPVLVDFWAAWCGPCQALGPLLEKIAAEHGGAFVLAKVDTDANPNLAAAFQIRSIPTVMLIKDGRPVDGFMGALPEAEIRDFLRPHLPEAPLEPHVDAQARLDRGDLEGARRVARRILEEDDQDARARLLLARIAFQAGNEDEVRTEVGKIADGLPERKTGETLLGAFRFRKDCQGDVATWRKALETGPDDLDARYQLGVCLAARGEYQEALEALLEVVKRDKRYRDGAAHQAMLAIFGILGGGSDEVREIRRQLSIYL